MLRNMANICIGSSIPDYPMCFFSGQYTHHIMEEHRMSTNTTTVTADTLFTEEMQQTIEEVGKMQALIQTKNRYELLRALR